MTSAGPVGLRPGSRLSRTEAALLGVALALSVAVLVGAFVVPTGGQSFDSGDPAGSRVETLTVADESGLALLVCALPLVATLVVGASLWRRTRLLPAWIAVGLLGLGMLAGIMTIGFALLPVLACLFVALVVRASHVDPPVRVADHSIRDGAPGARTPPPA